MGGLIWPLVKLAAVFVGLGTLSFLVWLLWCAKLRKEYG
jgi:hypothetical protein